MARPKKAETDTASIVDEEKTTTVETDSPVETESKPEEKAIETPEKADKEEKTEKKQFKDNDKVIIKCAAYAGKSLVLPTRTITLDEKGFCEVTGIEANRLLTIPGYELKK